MRYRTMTKAEIVSEIAAKTGLEKQVVLTVVEGMMDTIKTSMINGNEVFLRGFGSFIIKHRAEKTARNISKNTTIIIPAHNIPAFKPAKEFMEKVK
ncbi:HU family DNA-binding protein [Bacteroides thetaiotaomicron]